MRQVQNVVIMFVVDDQGQHTFGFHPNPVFMKGGEGAREVIVWELVAQDGAGQAQDATLTNIDITDWTFTPPSRLTDTVWTMAYDYKNVKKATNGYTVTVHYKEKPYTSPDPQITNDPE